jgi:Subtilase family/Secretion system C-terminal sorting domain
MLIMNQFLKIRCSLVIFSTIFFSQLFGQNSKIVISEQWRYGNNNSPIFFKAKSKTDDLKNVYVIGATLNSLNNRDLVIQKIDPFGNLIWQNTLSGDANLDDVGTDLLIDDQYNVYVTGTVNRLGTQEDLVVIKYSSLGVVIWEYFKDAPESEGGTSLILNSNKIFVTGVTSSLATQTDYLTVSLDATNGAFLWSNTYDYSNLNEVPASISIRNNDLYVSGASQLTSTPNVKWEIATIKYDATNGNENSVDRSSGNATQGIDEVHDILIDNNGDIFLVGGIVNQTTGYDIAIIKLDSNLNLIWQQIIDENGLDDVAYGIKLDNTGNIYITGFSTSPNESKNIFLKKIDNSGVELWGRVLKGESNLDDTGIEVCLINDTTIFITGYIRNNLDADVIISGFNHNGQILCTIEYADDNNLDDIPTSFCKDIDGDLIVSVQVNFNGGFKTKAIKYDVIKRSFEYSINPLTGKPDKVNNNLIIRFSKDAVNVSTYSNKNIKAGPANLYLNSNALNEINSKTGITWDNLSCYKVHNVFGPDDSLSITRYGDTISTNDFWTTLLIETPKTSIDVVLVDSLLTINKFIRSAGLNSVFFPSSIPNDTYYSIQNGLNSNLSYPNANINVEAAWIKEVGDKNIKVSVVDSQIDFTNLDFGGGTLQTSKIKGYNCIIDQNIANLGLIPNESHGTAVGGIIGAIRNNNYGIAGIAGGDYLSSNNGVKLINFVIFADYDVNGTQTPEVIEALALGNLSTTANNGYGVHIQNMSFGSTQPSGELNETLIEGFKNGCVLVAARGNKGYTSNIPEFPACFSKDNVVINVIASGIDGKRKDVLNGANEPNFWESSFGYNCLVGNCLECLNVDFMAPGTIELVKTTISSNDMNPLYPSCSLINPNFGCFNGTSAAAPHVSGTAALMISKHQNNNGFPNGLITEDVEHILEKTVFSQTPTFSLYSGYGRINAGEALEKVSDPYYVKHVVVPISSTDNLGLLSGTFNVNSSFSGVPFGNYSVEIFKCTFNQNVTLPSGHNIIDYWKMEALTNLGNMSTTSPTFYGGGTFIQNENLQVSLGGNTSAMSGETFTYKLTNANGISYWYPRKPADITFGYSLHVKKDPNASTAELLNNIFQIVPNPSNDQIELIFFSEIQDEINVEIIDEVGKTVFKDSYENISQIRIDISRLKDGMYYCKLVYNEGIINQPFIKVR